MAVACKTYRSENKDRNFRRESENLDLLKGVLHGSHRVMRHIASIMHGNNFMILLPLAELHDLEIFLRGGEKPLANTCDHQTIYEFDENFPHLKTESVLHSALLKELFEIASALVWLHDELRIFGSLDRYLAHMDLKPENILLASGPHHPAGKWMLTDFGVSLFDKGTNQRPSRLHSIRDAGPRLTSRGNRNQFTRAHGPYEPPEVDLPSVDGRKCDVWSFACILCDVLAFAFGRKEGLRQFRKLRYDGNDDYFYRTHESLTSVPRMVNSSYTELKPEIRAWYQGLAAKHKIDQSWIKDYVAVLERALVPNPSDRPNMRDFINDLGELPHKITANLFNSIEPPLIGPLLSSTSSTSDTTGINGRHLLRPSNSRGTSASPFTGITQTANRADISREMFQWNLEPTTNSTSTFRSSPVTIQFGALDSPRNNSQSSSNTVFTQHQTASTDPTSRIPSFPSVSSALLPAASFPSALSPNINASSYKQLQTTLTLRKKGKANAIAVAPDGSRVTFLNSNQVYAYSADTGELAGTINELPMKVDWKKMCIASSFVAVYGINKARNTIVSCY